MAGQSSGDGLRGGLCSTVFPSADGDAGPPDSNR